MKNTLLILIAGIFLLSACEKDRKNPNPDKDETPDSNKGCIFGKITKFYSGNATDAQIHLLDSSKIKIRSSSKITDFRFEELDGGIYYIMVTKNEFDTINPEPIRVIPNGNCQQVDWQISKLPPSLCVVEINTNTIELIKIDTLYYGTNLSMQRFKIYNNTDRTITWNIKWSEVRKSCDWVSEISCDGFSINNSGWSPEQGSISGTLYPEEVSEPVSIHIDRSKWSSDKNPALIPINGGGGWDLYINASVN